MIIVGEGICDEHQIYCGEIAHEHRESVTVNMLPLDHAFWGAACLRDQYICAKAFA